MQLGAARRGARPERKCTMHRLITLLHILHASSFQTPLQRCRPRGLKAAAEDSLATLKVPQLKALLKERGLKVSGKKQELIDRLEEHAAAERRRAENANVLLDRICGDGAQPRRNPTGNLLDTDAAPTTSVASAYGQSKLRESSRERKKCAIRAFQALPARDRGDRLPVGRRGS